MATRIDRFKVRRLMADRQMGRFEDLIDKAGISQTTFYTSVDSYVWKSKTLDAIAKALGCVSTDLLTDDRSRKPDQV